MNCPHKACADCSAVLLLLLPYLLHDLDWKGINGIYRFKAFVPHQREGSNAKESVKRIDHVLRTI